MLKRLAGRKLTLTLAVAVAMTAFTGVALAYAYKVVYGCTVTSSSCPQGANTPINETGKRGNFHIYGFGGNKTITAGLGNITIVNGKPVINGYDLIYGDGLCTQQIADNDSYCETPAPWLRQPWTSPAGVNTVINGGNGPSWLIGSGGNNTITGSKTYDLIVGGGRSRRAGGATISKPNLNTITGSALGSAIIAIQSTDVSEITLQKTTGVVGLDGLVGLPNAVDVYVPNRSSTLKPNVITCEGGTKNLDVIFANKNDTVDNCFRVFRGVSPIFPGQSVPPAVASTTEQFPFPSALTAISSSLTPGVTRRGRSDSKATKHSSKNDPTSDKHSKGSEQH